MKTKLVKESINEGQVLNSKYLWGTIEVNPLKKEIESRGFEFIDAREWGMGVQFRFKKNNITFNFEVQLDDDAAAFVHQLDWDDENGRILGWQPKHWMDDSGTDDALRALKRRLNKLSREDMGHEKPPYRG